MGEEFDRGEKADAYRMPEWSRFENNMVKLEQQLDRCKGDGEDSHPSNDRACLKTAAKEWDVQLNNVYQALQDDLPSSTANSLKNSERKWIGFQQAEEKAIKTILDKPDSNVAAARAYMELPKFRAEELRVSASDYDLPDLGYPTENCLQNARDAKSVNACYFNRINIAEGNMKGTYELLLSKLTPNEQKVLRASQAKWLDFRNEENKYIYSLHPQSGKYLPVSGVAAQIMVTEDRTRQFDHYLRNYQRGR